MSDSVTKPSGSGRSSTTTCADISLPENLLIRRSARRKRIGIKLASDGTVELLAPANADEQLLKQAWDHFQPWLRKKQCELQQLPAMFKPRKFEFAIGEKFFFCGTEYELRLQEKSSSRLITLRDGYLWSPTEDPAEIKKMLEAFYRRQTRRLAAGKLERYAREFNIRIGEISINGARKRFGSCSSRGDINFSWRLGMYPERLQELVILHELTHRKEMNHSRAFYSTLAGFLPDHRERDRELELWAKMLSRFPA